MKTVKITLTRVEISRFLFGDYGDYGKGLWVIDVTKKEDAILGTMFEFEVADTYWSQRLISKIEERHEEAEENMAKPATERKVCLLPLCEEIGTNARIRIGFLPGVKYREDVTLGLIASFTKKEILQIRQMGKVSVREIEEMLLRHGLKFKS